jgi:hypothetical protein
VNKCNCDFSVIECTHTARTRHPIVHEHSQLGSEMQEQKSFYYGIKHTCQTLFQVLIESTKIHIDINLDFQHYSLVFLTKCWQKEPNVLTSLHLHPYFFLYSTCSTVLAGIHKAGPRQPSCRARTRQTCQFPGKNTSWNITHVRGPPRTDTNIGSIFTVDYKMYQNSISV